MSWEPINQSINQSIDQSINQLINQTINCPFSPYLSELFALTAGCQPTVGPQKADSFLQGVVFNS